MVAVFFLNKTDICKFQKFKTKILGVGNVELYLRAKPQNPIQNSLNFRLHKNDKSDKFSSFKNVHCSSYLELHIFHFFLSLQCNEFGFGFCTLVYLIIIYI
jgi:hypothetical protein